MWLRFSLEEISHLAVTMELSRCLGVAAFERHDLRLHQVDLVAAALLGLYRIVFCIHSASQSQLQGTKQKRQEAKVK